MDLIWTKHAEDRQKEWEENPVLQDKSGSLGARVKQMVLGDMDVLVVQAA